jgi:hypothetical protein
MSVRPREPILTVEAGPSAHSGSAQPISTVEAGPSARSGSAQPILIVLATLGTPFESIAKSIQ